MKWERAWGETTKWNAITQYAWRFKTVNLIKMMLNNSEYVQSQRKMRKSQRPYEERETAKGLFS